MTVALFGGGEHAARCAPSFAGVDRAVGVSVVSLRVAAEPAALVRLRPFFEALRVGLDSLAPPSDGAAAAAKLATASASSGAAPPARMIVTVDAERVTASLYDAASRLANAVRVRRARNVTTIVAGASIDNLLELGRLRVVDARETDAAPADAAPAADAADAGTAAAPPRVLGVPFSEDVDDDDDDEADYGFDGGDARAAVTTPARRRRSSSGARRRGGERDDAVATPWWRRCVPAPTTRKARARAGRPVGRISAVERAEYTAAFDASTPTARAWSTRSRCARRWAPRSAGGARAPSRRADRRLLCGR